MIRELWLNAKRHLLAYLLAFIGKYVVKMIWKTCRVRVHGLEQFKALAARERCIVATWHNRISIICEFFATYAPEVAYAAFLSNSRDGEPIAHIVESYPSASTIRVAHNRRHSALREAIGRLRRGEELLIITPDGPRGPRYKAKAGIIAAARQSAALIIPLSWEASRYWQFNTWDQFRIPKPFSLIEITLAPPYRVAGDSEIADEQRQVEVIMGERASTI